MVSADKPVFDIDTPGGISTDLIESIEASDRLNAELAFLFGKETVDQASQIDIADLNLNEKIIDSISTGVRKLKELKDNPNAQITLVNEMEPGTRLVLCMWIMDMGLLEKIQNRSYLDIRG